MKILILFCLSAFFILPGCNRTDDPSQKPLKERLIYCGITRIKPMSEIAGLIEEQENCKITITKGGSGNLQKSIRANMIGDLYLPGSDSYIETCRKEGIFTEVINNARILTTDSKDLINVLKDKRADLVINWYATSTWPENHPFVDVLPIESTYGSPKNLVLGLLKTARYPEIARKFLALAESEQGQAIFRKYGLYDVP